MASRAGECGWVRDKQTNSQKDYNKEPSKKVSSEPVWEQLPHKVQRQTGIVWESEPELNSAGA